jgi:hypothetical protein
MSAAQRMLAAGMLAAVFSCSGFNGSARDHSPLAPDRIIEQAAGPGAADFIYSRFLDFHLSLAPDEIRAVSEAVVEESLANDMTWDLVLAVIHTESAFHNFAVSRVGAMGLMQIMPATGRTLARQLDVDWDGPRTLFRPLVNVKFGTAYLRWLHDRYGDWDLALAAYNWGPGRIDGFRARGSTMPAQYVNRVMSQVRSPHTLAALSP